MKYLSVPLLLLITASAFSIDPPVKLWEKQYYGSFDGCFFEDIELTSSGDCFITGTAWDWTPVQYPHKIAFLLNTDGEVIWDVESPFYGIEGADGAILANDSYIITGTAVVDQDSSYSLFIMKIDQNGSIEWTKIYDYPETKEEGYGITCLPDGGFAVCGKVNGTGQWAGEAWLLRTDSQGDTLWTATWGTDIENYGKAVLFNNNEFCMLTKGGVDSLSQGDTHLVFFDSDGNYLRGTDYPELYYLFPASLCATANGGYTFTTESFPPVWHTDQYGETLWWKGIYVTPNDWHKGYCIRTTMDNGYIFCGWDGYFEYEPDGRLVDYEEGWLARFDSEGNELWNINNTISVDHAFYSCLQLPEGGYVCCGTYGYWEDPYDTDTESRGPKGFLVRYAPETGIEGIDPPSSLLLEVSPNPCSSVLSVSFSLPAAGHASLRIYDLSARLISTAVDGMFPAGSNTVDWTVPEGVPSGCYLIHLTAGQEIVTKNLVLLR